jgi:D-alanine-D-alanine ligase
MSDKFKVIVLAGGTSPERNVSLASGDAVGTALHQAGHEVIKIDPAFPGQSYGPEELFLSGEVGEEPPQLELEPLTHGQVQDLIRALASHSPDVIFPILHGGWGEDGRLQSLLEITGFRYVGSNPRASAVAMHKPTTKRLFQWKGIPTPDWLEFPKNSCPSIEIICSEIQKHLGFPAVMKPSSGGSTIGLTKINDESDVSQAVSEIIQLGDDILVEPWIEGREITVAILNGSPLPIIEIKPREGFYNYLNKYTHGQTDYICPAELSLDKVNELSSFATEAFKIIGCRHFARVDFLLTQSGEPYCLEVNTLPGMTSTSLVPKAAKAQGIGFPELTDRLVKMALEA